MALSGAGRVQVRVSQSSFERSVQVHRSAQKLDPREEHYWVDSPRDRLQLFLLFFLAHFASLCTL